MYLWLCFDFTRSSSILFRGRGENEDELDMKNSADERDIKGHRLHRWAG